LADSASSFSRFSRAASVSSLTPAPAPRSASVRSASIFASSACAGRVARVGPIGPAAHDDLTTAERGDFALRVEFLLEPRLGLLGVVPVDLLDLEEGLRHAREGQLRLVCRELEIAKRLGVFVCGLLGGFLRLLGLL
jgi:hypothetical protein